MKRLFIKYKALNALLIVVIISLIFMVIYFSNLFASKEVLKVIVVNNFNETLTVEVAYYCWNDNNLTMKIYTVHELEPAKSYVFKHEFDRAHTIAKIDIAVYNLSYYKLYKKQIYKVYNFSKNITYDILAIISESGKNITIIKMPSP